MKKYFSIFFSVLILIAISLPRKETQQVMHSMFPSVAEPSISATIVIDPGHGGFDPGKIAVNQALEKDINLSISLKLRKLMEKDGIKVILTRESDVGLYQDGDSNKKRADLNKRIEIINNGDADFALSIHQNSFTQESVNGAQMFYHAQSAEGEELAKILQDSFKNNMPQGNRRQAKANDSYFMLKKTTCPLVIVECGYLSNYTEANLLIKEEYQELVANVIYKGVLAYIDTLKKGPLQNNE